MVLKLSTDWDGVHRRNIENYSKQVDAILADLAREAAKLGIFGKNSASPFTFDKHPQLKKRFDLLLEETLKGIDVIISAGEEIEWDLANSKNNDIVKTLFKGINYAPPDKYLQRNISALEAFQKQKIDGLRLSDRVWGLKGQIKQELEMGIDIGLVQGDSAEKMGKSLRKYLNEPEKLFRRVRNERGTLHLSKNAAAYHPGQGVYRSSRANALRLTRTNTNMSYRSSDNERWQQLDFVLGYEVRRSNNPYPCPVCEALKGKYPKNFVFIGWHPNCRCFAVAIVAKIEELIEQQLAFIESGKTPTYQGLITNVPDNFSNWLSNNSDSLNRSYQNGTYPYFLKLNKEFVSKIVVF